MQSSAELQRLCLPPNLPTPYEPLIIPVDKPAGWSSFHVVRRLRSILRIRKIGHAGTLDPMATGLLICLTGRATKRMETFMLQPKEYTGTLRLGETTPSYDAETPIYETRPSGHITDVEVATAASAYVGEIVQLAPMYSAVKVGGERLYRKARRGETLLRPPRHVTVHSFEVLERRDSDVDFHVRCSRGTYIRSLAHDLGQALGCGAHLVALRRTAIGTIRVDDAWTMEEIEKAAVTSAGPQG